MATTSPHPQLNSYVAACKTMTAKLREFITSGSWDVFFSQHFPNLPHELYKPDPYNLDPCD
jgi:glutamate transport system substrate-binding protein